VTQQAHAAQLFDDLRQLVAEIKTARDQADKNGRPYPPWLIEAIRGIRGQLRAAGVPQADIDATSGLELKGKNACQ
jgi:hypothetical protein